MLRQYRERQFQAGLHAPVPEEDRRRLFKAPPNHRGRQYDTSPRPIVNFSPRPIVNYLPTRCPKLPLKHITNSFRTLFQRDRRRRGASL